MNLPRIAFALAAVALVAAGLHAVIGAEPAPPASDPAVVPTITVRELKDGNLAPARAMPAVRKDAATWKKDLPARVFAILRQQDTERPFTSALLKEQRLGWFVCAGCGLPLYASADKFDSGTGWPSFTRAADPAQIVRLSDQSHGWKRVELRCARCDGHLGHVFDDGPAPTGERHCINGLALDFKPAP